jgi:hypothetical protein
MQGGRSNFFGTLFARGNEIFYYEIANQYDQSVTGFAGDYEYFGYLNSIGGWIIQQHQISTGIWLYVGGLSLYSTAWSNKGGLSYASYSALFS